MAFTSASTASVPAGLPPSQSQPASLGTTGPSLFRALQLRQLVGNSNGSFSFSSDMTDSDSDFNQDPTMDTTAVSAFDGQQGYSTPTAAAAAAAASSSLPSPPRSRHPSTVLHHHANHSTHKSHHHVLPPIIPSARDYSPFAHRLQVASTLEGHQGCVNTVHWSQDAELIISGSDDQHIRIWDATTLDPVSSFHSGHSSNVFSVLFLPNTNHHEIISCAADGSVHYTRLSDASLSSPAHTGRFLCHSDTTNNLALDPLGSPHVFFSCSDDGLVLRYDLRERTTCPCAGAPCARHTLIDFGHVLHARPSRPTASDAPRSSSRFLRRLFGGPPLDAGVAAMDWVPGHPHWLGVGTNNDSVCVFDVRACGAGGGGSGAPPEPFYVWRPPFAGTKRRARVPHKITDMRFDPLKAGAEEIEFLVSFSEEDVYLVRPDWERTSEEGGGFKAVRSSGRPLRSGDGKGRREHDEQVVGVFSGHCNERTMIKQANFFGTHHLLCGSDDGLLYVWDRATAQVLDVIPGADGHIVNCVQPHPDLPYVLTSGIDDSIKLVQPLADPPSAAAHEVVDGLNPCDRQQVRRVRTDTGAEERVRRVARAVERNARVRAGGYLGSGTEARLYGEGEDDDAEDMDGSDDEDNDDGPRYISLEDLLRANGSGSPAAAEGSGEVDASAAAFVRFLLGGMLAEGDMDDDEEEEEGGAENEQAEEQHE